MKYERLNIDWNAEPNAPEPNLTVENGNVVIKFYLNYFLYEQFSEGDIGKLTFTNCKKFDFNNVNDERYFSGKYRYSENDLPWGDFYKILTSENDFPKNPEITEINRNVKNLNHYIFFFRDNTFECLAENYKFEIIK